MEKQLELARQLQRKYPKLALGGSLALKMQGINIYRDWDKVDLDFSTYDCLGLDEYLQKHLTKTHSEGSADMQWHFEIEDIKVQVMEDEERQAFTIMYEGDWYLVHTIPYIMLWKARYAEKGVDKHIHDLKLIKTLLYLEEYKTIDF